MVKKPIVKLNNKVVKGMTRKVFIDSHKAAYPNLTEEELGKLYDKAVGKPVADNK